MAMSAEGIEAVSCVVLTKVVVRLPPFHCTTEAETKLEPSTVIVKAESPSVALAGVKTIMAGTGLLMVKVAVFEVPPPGTGLKTVTSAVPAEAMSVGGMEAVNWVLLTKVVVRSLPFQRTTEPETKFEPSTVSVKPWSPARALPGVRLVMTGSGLLMLKTAMLEVPPPGGGLNTVT